LPENGNLLHGEETRDLHGDGGLAQSRQVLGKTFRAEAMEKTHGLRLKHVRENKGKSLPRVNDRRRPSPPIRPKENNLAPGPRPTSARRDKDSARKSEREGDGEPPPRRAMPGFVAPYPVADRRRPSPPNRPNRKILRRAGQAGGRPPNQGIKIPPKNQSEKTTESHHRAPQCPKPIAAQPNPHIYCGAAASAHPQNPTNKSRLGHLPG
jgi:hypothetical protein